MLEEEEYLRRKEYYQESGQRHYYFMNIGNGEVIDAARKVSHLSMHKTCMILYNTSALHDRPLMYRADVQPACSAA